MTSNNGKKATLNDVATHAGVSSSLVSRYVRGLSVSPKRAAIIQTSIEELGYVHNVMAGNLSSASSNVVGIVVPYIDDEFYSEILQYIQDYIRSKGFWLQIACSNYEPKVEEEAIKAMLGWNPKYIAVVGYNHTDYVQNLMEGDSPSFIQISDIYGQSKAIKIGLDHFKIGQQAALHLYNGGCKKLAFIGMDLKRDRAAGRRAEGFQAIAKLNGDSDPLVVDLSYGINSFNFAAEVLLDILANEPDIDGICTSDDNLAVGILIEARNRNIAIPDRMSVIGYGNSRLGYAATPALSTIDPYASMMATEVAKALTGQINNFPGEEIMETSFRVVVRNTSRI
ncbi:LacI family DNA-binding transcriptional regulator [Vibrio cyclitrophicus]|uniref:LacI family DNA-binding transcriptional regulator n=3 Tax=Vibrio cyclitrophicus TaxID=47951 RepID=UPI0003173D13|nr:LacI family DNA-binding transcriptional regulator [Vibrio cyclitrophicus]OEF24929.1 hypothetical protein OA9_16875 [Vibrio cyclitrophicus 1F97]OEF33291.1 hypothetical protein OA7_14510 [Vibrio cyclitrophicus 1F53]OEF43378.1 hypothetical protein OAC_09880 [Vibrio cyclitrophicus 1F273]OEF66695.1 hypothetical protein OAA_08095 [Vibrio cyclitrophicus 1F175]PMH36271.1 hypothetical protein BCU72_08930 [Vibrio cyclitrophicus]